MKTAVVNVLSSQDGSNNQDITFSASPSWTPKVAIVQYNRADTSNDTFQEHMAYGFGWTDGTNQRTVSIVSEDNQARSDTGTVQGNNALIYNLTPSGTVTTVDGQAAFSSWLTNGMRINWSNPPASQFYIQVLFLGGDDVTDTAVGTLSTGTGTGSISITSLSFQADVGMFMMGGSTTENSGVSDAFLSVGAATSSSAQWCQAVYSQDNPVTMITRQEYSHSSTTGVATVYTNSGINGKADFTSFNSNGFTLNVGDAFSSSFPIYYLLIKGGQYAVGNNTEPGSTGDQTNTTSKDTQAVMVFGLDIGTADTISNGLMWTSGMGDGTTQNCCVYEDTNGSADSVVVSRNDSNQIYLNITSNATATSSTLDDEATLSAISSTGFTLNWSNIGQARPYRYITFGSTANTNYERSISEGAVSVSQTISRTLAATRTVSETAVSVSDLSDRTPGKVRTISEDAISVDQAISRMLSAARTPSEPSVSIGQSIARMVEAIRTISETAVSVSDSANRTPGKARTVSETTTVSDSVSRLNAATRGISETTTVSDNVTTSKALTRLVAETTSVSDILARMKTTARTISETTTVSDNIARMLSLSRSISQSVSVSDTVSALRSLIRSISNSVSISDSVSQIKTSGGGPEPEPEPEPEPTPSSLLHSLPKKKSRQRAGLPKLIGLPKQFQRFNPFREVHFDFDRRKKESVIVPPSPFTAIEARSKIIISSAPAISVLGRIALAQFSPVKTASKIILKDGLPLSARSRIVNQRNEPTINPLLAVTKINKIIKINEILQAIDAVNLYTAAIQKKKNTTQIDITQTKAFKETQRVEKQIQKKLEQFYDEILAKVPSKTIDQLKIEYTPKIRQVVRAAIQTVYVSGTNYATKTTDIPAFVTQKDVENIRKHTDSLVAAFWRRLTVAADVKAQNEFFPALPSPPQGKAGLESGQLSSHITEAEPVTTPDSDSVLLPAVITSALTMTLTQGLLSKLQQTRNLEEIKRKVIWVTKMDEKVCPICQALDGQDWDEDDPSVPIPGPDSSHYNCRCRILVKDADGDILEDI